MKSPEVSFSTFTIQQKKKITSLICRNTQEALETVNATKKIKNEAVAETDAGLADMVFKNIASVCFVRYSNMSRRLQGLTLLRSFLFLL